MTTSLENLTYNLSDGIQKKQCREYKCLIDYVKSETKITNLSLSKMQKNT